MSFAQKFSSQSGNATSFSQIINQKALVCDVRYQHPQGEAWYVLGVDREKADEFNAQRQQHQPMTLSDYGTILHSGWGAEPPESLKTELHEKYGLYDV